jgi:hypothetical protein
MYTQVEDHKRRAKLDFEPDHFFCSRVMALGLL